MKFDPEVTKNESIMRLAHPQRCASAWTKAMPSWDAIFGPKTWGALRDAFSQPDTLTPDVITVLTADPNHRLLAQFVHRSAEDTASTELGGTYATALHWRQSLFPQPHFLVEDALLEMLEHTDISDDLPMSVLQPPYPRCYIEFGKSRTCEQRIPNLESGLHVLEGAYIEEGGSPLLGRGLFITFTGSPLGKENALDDATDSIFLSTANPDRLIRDVMAETRAHSRDLAHLSHLRVSPTEYAEYSFSALKLLITALLYLGLPDARKSLHPERTEFAKHVAAKKNPSKRARAESQLRQMTDYILVTAPPPLKGSSEHPELDNPGVRRHWRRGHYRLQPHGPQSSLRKVIFLRPQLIGGAAVDVAMASPQYHVR